MNPTQTPRGRRLDGYIRVSDVRGREGDSYITEKVQEERIRSWAAAYGHEIVEMHHETDVSGGTMDRPLLNEVMARIESGETEGVVVFNISRFGRTLVGSIELVHRINARGALFASVSDGFDITTVTGRMVLGILLSIAQAEREKIGESWLTAKTSAVDRGIHVSAQVPFGYRRGRGAVNPRTGKAAPAPLEPDPDTAWVVPELFKRRAAGDTWESMRAWLVENNIPTVRGGAWSSSTLLTTIRNRVYLGEARGVGDSHVNTAAHEPLVDEATWHAAQSRHRARHQRRNDQLALLIGLVRCGSCRYVMQARPTDGRRGAIYICNSRVGCPRPANIAGCGANGAPGLDDYIVDMARGWEQVEQERILFEGFDPVLDIESEEQELAELVAARERDRLDQELQAALGRQEWLKHLRDLTARVDEKQATIETKMRQIGTPYRAAMWEKWASGEMSLEEKRTHLAASIQAVFVNPATKRRSRFADPELRRRWFVDRVQVVRSTDPLLTVADIPRHGRTGYRIKPWPFSTNANPDHVGVVPLQPEVKDAGETVV
jgi:DNA invertase Pin-like site-specific DNA recombinase